MDEITGIEDDSQLTQADIDAINQADSVDFDAYASQFDPAGIAEIIAEPKVGRNRSNIIGMTDRFGRNIYSPKYAQALNITRNLLPGNTIERGSNLTRNQSFFARPRDLTRPENLRPTIRGEDGKMYFSRGEQFIQNMPQLGIMGIINSLIEKGQQVYEKGKDLYDETFGDTGFRRFGFDKEQREKKFEPSRVGDDFDKALDLVNQREQTAKNIAEQVEKNRRVEELLREGEIAQNFRDRTYGLPRNLSIDDLLEATTPGTSLYNRSRDPNFEFRGTPFNPNPLMERSLQGDRKIRDGIIENLDRANLSDTTLAILDGMNKNINMNTGTDVAFNMQDIRNMITNPNVIGGAVNYGVNRIAPTIEELLPEGSTLIGGPQVVKDPITGESKIDNRIQLNIPVQDMGISSLLPIG